MKLRENDCGSVNTRYTGVSFKIPFPKAFKEYALQPQTKVIPI